MDCPIHHHMEGDGDVKLGKNTNAKLSKEIWGWGAARCIMICLMHVHTYTETNVSHLPVRPSLSGYDISPSSSPNSINTLNARANPNTSGFQSVPESSEVQMIARATSLKPQNCTGPSRTTTILSWDPIETLDSPEKQAEQRDCAGERPYQKRI